MIKENEDLLYKRWEKWVNSDNFVQADKLYGKLRQANIGDGAMSLTMGLWYRQQGLYEEALEALTQALTMDFAQKAEVCCELANTFEELSRWEESEKFYHMALQLKPDFSEAIFNYGHLLLQMHQDDEAKVQFCQVAALNPHKLEAYISVATALSEAEFKDEAIEIYNQALIWADNPCFLYSNLGVEYTELGEFHEAIFYHEKALQSDGSSGDVWYNLACTCSLMGDIDRGLFALGKAIIIDRGNKMYAENDFELAALQETSLFWKLMAL